MNQTVTKSSVIAAIYVVFEGIAKHWNWDDETLNVLLSTAQLPSSPVDADVQAFLERSELIFWRLAVDDVAGAWDGDESSDAYIGAHPFWSVEVWFDDQHPMSAQRLSKTIMAMASTGVTPR